MVDQNDPTNPQSLAYAKEQAERQAGRPPPGAALEAEAVALMKQYGFFLPPAAKSFFRKLADYLNWQTLKGSLK